MIVTNWQRVGIFHGPMAPKSMCRMLLGLPMIMCQGRHPRATTLLTGFLHHWLNGSPVAWAAVSRASANGKPRPSKSTSRLPVCHIVGTLLGNVFGKLWKPKLLTDVPWKPYGGNPKARCLNITLTEPNPSLRFPHKTIKPFGSVKSRKATGRF